MDESGKLYLESAFLQCMHSSASVTVLFLFQLQSSPCWHFCSAIKAIKTLGMTLDSNFTFKSHITNLYKSCLEPSYQSIMLHEVCSYKRHVTDHNLLSDLLFPQ